MLAKMTPHGLLITGSPFGGKSEISALDVAAALGMGGLSHPAYQFGLLKFTGDSRALAVVDRMVRTHVGAMAKAEGWGITDEQVRGLARLVIVEHMESPVCSVCNGSGSVAAKPCEHCSGVGRVPLSKRRRAEIAGIERTAWNRHWDGRGRRIWLVVAEWEAELVSHLQRHFAPERIIC
jgi:hypothetical protein